MDSPRAPGTSPCGLDPSMLVGVPEIDEQHRELVCHLDCLVGARDELAAPERFTDVLGELGRALCEHFETEERYFVQWDMPAPLAAAHRFAHSEILGQYTDLNLDLMNRKVIEPSAVARMLKGWIVDHVREHDLALRRYACEPG